MQRLIDILAKTSHRVIVSKGPLASPITLHDNMVGEGLLPSRRSSDGRPGHHPRRQQHRHRGVPPRQADDRPAAVLGQVDNAQRVDETRFGRRLSTYGFADEELTGAIDALLGDNALKKRLTVMSKRIKVDERDGPRCGPHRGRRDVMLRGERISLRPIKQADLDELYDHHVEIATRGSFYPLGVMSETTSASASTTTASGTARRARWSSSMATGGSWVRSSSFARGRTGMPYELAYHLYDPAAAGKGYTTEAVQLLADYLFANREPRHRLQLIILPGNAASRRIAEKCRFQLDGTIRQPFFSTAARTSTSSCIRSCGRTRDPGARPRRRKSDSGPLGPR